MLMTGRASNDEEAEDEVMRQQIAQGLGTAAFLNRFREAAEHLVQTVVHELAVSNDARSIPELPLDECERELFVSSGGTNMHKFWSNGLIAFVVGCESSSIQSARSLQSTIAHKLLGHQLRASRAIHDVIHRQDSDCESLRVPLQCTVDYLGFRCITFASNDASLMRRSAELTHQPRDFQIQLKSAFDALCLITDSLQASASSALDVKGEVVPSFTPTSARFETLPHDKADKTQQILIHSLRGLFPADITTTNCTSDPVARAAEFALFKLRPEFVKLYGEMLPLHSNAHLSPANTNDNLPDSGRHNRHELLERQLLQQAACSASQYLQYQVAPSFIRSLEEEGGATPSSAAAHVFDSRSLTRAMHREGINMRYLGICFSVATKKHVKRLMLSEMLARVCKIELRAALRTIVHETATKVLEQALATDSCAPETREATIEDQTDYERDAGNEERATTDPVTIRALSTAISQSEARQVVVAFFNLVLRMSSADAKLFWKERLLPHVRRKFGFEGCHQLSSLESILNDDLLHVPQLSQALQFHSQVAFKADGTSFNWKHASPFTLEDLQPHSLAPLTKLIARTTAQCEDSLANVDTLLENQQFEDALLQLKLHIAILTTSPQDERALPLSHLLVCAAELSFQLDLMDDAGKFAALAVENSPRNDVLRAKAHTISMKISHHHVKRDLDAVRTHFTKAVEVAQWHLGTLHPFLLDTYLTMVEILSDSCEFEEALKVLTVCIATARECFGKKSLVYADLRRRQGLLLFESKENLDEAVSMLEDAISVYERHFQDDDSGYEETLMVGSSCKALAASCCFVIATIHKELSRARSDTEKAFSMARRALTLRKEVLPTDHVDTTASLLQLGALAVELDDHFRALEYFKPALAMLKDLKDEESAEQIRIVTHTMLPLQLQALTEEKKSVVERTRKRFAGLMTSFTALYNSDQASPGAATESCRFEETSEAHQLLAFVMKKLFTEDASEYLAFLVERTDQELQAYRRQNAMNLTSTMRKESAEAPSPHFKRLQTPGSPQTFGSRFASFSGVGSYMSPPDSTFPAPPSSLAMPLSPTRPDAVVAMPPSPVVGSDSLSSPLGSRRLTACTLLTTASGEFTFGGQLSALLFLAELLPAEAGEVEVEGDV
ncbi:hypothetical protein Gpo141_00008066 [Globisporangium polare]